MMIAKAWWPVAVLCTLAGPHTTRAAPSSTGKVSADAIFPITRADYPGVYAAWGDTGISRINALMPKAAQKAAESTDCDRVEFVGYSDRSTPRRTVVLYVDCANKKRFLISEAEMQSKAAPVSKEAKTAGFSDARLIEACEQSVRSQLKYPLTFSRSWTSTGVYRAPGGNVLVMFSFESKNALGATLLKKVRCAVDDQGMSPAEITNK